MKMNTVIKITALAVIVALAAISCGPEVELSGVDWGALNDGNNSEKNTTPVGETGGDPSFYTGGWDAELFKVAIFNPPLKTDIGGFGAYDALSLSSTSFDTNVDTNPLRNQITVTFPKDSDFLKRNLTGNALLEALKEFLSFHNYTTPETDDEHYTHFGKASTLGDPLVYELDEKIQRSGNTVYLRFPSKPADTSNVIMKIDGTKYTYASGNKMDRSDRGRPGKDPLYDDVWVPIAISNPKDNTADWTFPSAVRTIRPRNIGWSLSLLEFPFPEDIEQPENKILENKTLEVTDVEIASLSLSGYLPKKDPSATDGKVEALYQTIADQIKASGTFKVQTYDRVAKRWNDAPGTIEYHGAEGTTKRNRGSFYLNSFTYKDLEPVRVVWEGNNDQPIISADDYYGVKQWIKIYDAATAEDDTKHEYYRKTVYGPVSLLYTYPAGSHQRFGLDGQFDSVEVFSVDPFGKNVIIDIRFEGIEYGEAVGTPPTQPKYWLKEYPNLDTAAGLKAITDNFKIAYVPSGGSTAAFEDNPDVVYIPIKAITLEKVGRENGLDTIRVTLDPNYKLNTPGTKYFYVSPEMKFNDDKSSFGNPANWQNNFWGVYGVSGF
jgi:hypothetical protein